jgi:hypothetical protein
MPVENQTAPNATPDLQGVPGRPCRLCSAPLVMLPSIASGKTVPIDARAPVYVIFRDAHNKRWVRPAKDMLWELQHATPEVAEDADLMRQALLAAAQNREPGEE